MLRIPHLGVKSYGINQNRYPKLKPAEKDVSGISSGSTSVPTLRGGGVREERSIRSVVTLTKSPSVR
jgi:hypothetical protein